MSESAHTSCDRIAQTDVERTAQGRRPDIILAPSAATCSLSFTTNCGNSRPRMAAERPGQTLDPTALVDEADLRQIGDRPLGPWALLRRCRPSCGVCRSTTPGPSRLKRGGERNRVVLHGLLFGCRKRRQSRDLDGALVVRKFPAAAVLVKRRFFARMTLGDAAEILSMARRTADRHWAFARAWLADAVGRG